MRILQLRTVGVANIHCYFKYTEAYVHTLYDLKKSVHRQLWSTWSGDNLQTLFFIHAHAHDLENHIVLVPHNLLKSCLSFLLNRFLPHSSGWPRTHSVHQASLEQQSFCLCYLSIEIRSMNSYTQLPLILVNAYVFRTFCHILMQKGKIGSSYKVM